MYKERDSLSRETYQKIWEPLPYRFEPRPTQSLECEVDAMAGWHAFPNWSILNYRREELNGGCLLQHEGLDIPCSFISP